MKLYKMRDRIPIFYVVPKIHKELDSKLTLVTLVGLLSQAAVH